MPKYYVYEYWRLDNNTCFYVGKGRQKSCGKLKDGTPLVWMYYTDYIKECA